MEYRWSHEFHPKSPILNFKFTDVTNLSVYIKSTVPKGKVHVNQLDSLQVKYPFQAHHLAFTEEPGAARGQSVLALLPKRRFHTGISKLSKSSPQVQVLLMLWERKKKIASTNKNSSHVDAELCWKQQGNTCAFKASSFKKCHEINENKNAMLAKVPRLSFIPNSH